MTHTGDDLKEPILLQSSYKVYWGFEIYSPFKKKKILIPPKEKKSKIPG